MSISVEHRFSAPFMMRVVNPIGPWQGSIQGRRGFSIMKAATKLTGTTPLGPDTAESPMAQDTINPSTLRHDLPPSTIQHEQNASLTIEDFLPAPDVMSILQVARFLHCSVDRVRRISRTELPGRNGPGRLVLYLKSEVIDYVNHLPHAGRRNSGLSASSSKSFIGAASGRTIFDLEAARNKLIPSNG